MIGRLTLAIFVPAVGLGLVLLVPKAEENTAKVVALLTSLVTLAVGIGILAEFDYDRAGKLQFGVNEAWIDVIQAAYHLGLDGISLPTADPFDVHHGAVHHLLVEPLPGAAQPEGASSR